MYGFLLQLRKAIIDHISDSFLDTTVPLLVLIEAAKNGRQKEIKEYAAIFREHTSRLVEVCFMELQFFGIYSVSDLPLSTLFAAGRYQKMFKAGISGKNK